MLGSIVRKDLSMSIQTTKKSSDLEKRLKLLRTQVHGKEQFRFESNSTSSSPASDHLSDMVYLKNDLLKIGIFSTLALGFQIILFLFFKHSILNLKFF
jgi:hypothetical protein